jgi:pyruvate formate lyase activating enzyme
MRDGMIFDIQKFSINDGPGIRTTVFLKGCPLNCAWCHNPESKEKEPEISYNREKCLNCGQCVFKCRYGCHQIQDNLHVFDRRNCVRCGACTETACPALETVGRLMPPEEVIIEVMKDKAFYDHSGGGLTVSGGEPMYQAEFTGELLQLAKVAGLHTCMETSGFAATAAYQAVAELVDIFLFDYKETNPRLHEEYVGMDNRLILENLKVLDDLGSKIILRCPVIPAINDRKDHLVGIAETANRLKNISEIQIEPYHPLGESKAANIGREYRLSGLPFADSGSVSEWIAEIQSHTDVMTRKA